MMPLRHCDARPGRVGKEVLRLTGVEDVGREGERGGQTRTLDRLRVGDVWRVEDRLAEESSGNGGRVSMDDEGGGTERVDTVAGCVGGVANYSQKAGAGEEGVVEMVEIGETGSAVDRQTAGLSVVTGGAGDRGFQEEIQNAVYKISKENDIPLKQWFQLLYEILLGTKEGPRMGTFIKLYGLKEVKKLNAEKID